MAAAKYGDQIKNLKFQNYDRGCLRQVCVMDKDFLGINTHIQYGACWTAGKLGNGSNNVPHVHDFDQVMCFIGSDVNDLSDLRGELELCLGEEQETHITTSSVAVAIPRGFPHYHANINSLDNRIIFMEISNTAEYKETPVATDKKPTGPAGWKSKYKKHIMPLSFAHKGAWYYGPDNRDDGGGAISFVKTADLGIDFVMLYESMRKAPYRLCPDPDKPHAHPTTQAMCFLGTDTDDLRQLNAEFEICLGKEEERHVFNTPTVVVTPPFLPHWPGGLLKLTRPIIMADIHPFGNDH